MNKLRRAEQSGTLALATGGKGERTHLESDEPPAPALELPADELKDAEKRLAAFIGPIARIIVKKAARESRSRDAFYDRLADELSDADEKDDFLSGVKH